MRKLRVLVSGLGLVVASTQCGPLSSRDDPARGGSDAAGGDGVSASGGAAGGSTQKGAGEAAEGGHASGVGGSDLQEGGHPTQVGGAAGSDGEAGAGGEPELEPVGPITLAELQVTPTGIAVDQSYVYWANRDAGTIVRCHRYGCKAGEPTVLASEVAAPLGVTVDATHLYWVNAGGSATGAPGRIYKCPLSGCDGTPTLLTQWVVNNRTNDLHVADGVLYVAAWPLLGTCPIDGCEGPSLLSGGSFVSVDTDADYVYAGLYGAAQVVRCPLGGCGDGTLTVSIASSVTALAVAVDASSVYFANHDYSSAEPQKHELVKCPIAGCGEQPPELVLGGDISPYGLTLDATRLYFTNVVQGTVVSIPK